MVFRDKLVNQDLKETEVYLLYWLKTKYIKIVLGGTAPGFWGEVGLPGARGRPGGKYFLTSFVLI
jgi:hypothetical protein